MSSVDIQNASVEEGTANVFREKTLERKKNRNGKCSSKCNACLSFLVIIVMCLTGFNATAAGILSSVWKEKFNVTYEQLARVWMIDGVGIMVASLTCSLLLCIETRLGFAVGTLLMPLFPCPFNFVCFQLSGLAGGFGRGLIFVYGTRILSKWPKSSSLVLIQLSFVSYAVGGLMASQLSDYYKSLVIVWKNNFTSIEIKSSTFWINQWNISSSLKEKTFEVSLMQVIELIICCGLFFIILIWALSELCGRKPCSRKISNSETIGVYEDFKSINKTVGLNFEEDTNQTKEVSRTTGGSFLNGKTQKWFADNRVLDATLLMFLFTHFVFAFGMESILIKFLGSIDQIFSGDNKHKSFNNSSIYSIFCGLTIVGRFLSITFSKSYSSTTIVAICLATNVITTAVASAYYDKSENLALFCIAVLGAFLGPLLPAGLSWSNTHLCYCRKSLGLAFTCAGLGCASFSWIVGITLSRLNEMYVMFFITGACSLCCVAYIPLLVKLKKVNGTCVLPTVTYV